jgi:hypothetical protein
MSVFDVFGTGTIHRTRAWFWGHDVRLIRGPARHPLQRPYMPRGPCSDKRAEPVAETIVQTKFDVPAVLRKGRRGGEIVRTFLRSSWASPAMSARPIAPLVLIAETARRYGGCCRQGTL